MSDDALAYLVEAFGHVSEAELNAFLDAAPVPAQTLPDLRETVLAAAVPTQAHEPARAA
ncbi:hypothetical protein [Methylobacterium sp. Leaf456]|uniref:hypothetical protein n=1 Tax=Methylobacterium sp. Leaf456 TaxID=1736382 RepID=UPI000A86A552|nr:hypothetical protein [Methylobacterium sp. Leaf456]